MFTHEIQAEVFETHILSNGDKTTYIKVVPERGGIVTEFIVNNKPIFYLDNNTLIDPSKNIRGGNPILFPICSYLKDNTYTLEGKAYNMKQHGFGRNLPWRVTTVETMEKSALIRLELVDNDFTKAQFPFSFRLIMDYILDEKSLTVSSTLINRDSRPLPFYGGYHPYFYAENKEKVEIQVPSGNFTEVIEGSLKDGRFNYSQDELDVEYTDLEKDSCTILDYGRGLRIKIGFDSIYKYIVVWSLKGRDFVCVEPWMASTDALNTGEDLVWVEPGKELTSRVVYEVEGL